MLDIFLAGLMTVVIATGFALIFTRNHDMLMVKAFRCYTTSRAKSNAIIKYVTIAWTLFPYLLSIVCIGSYILSYEFLKYVS